MTGIRRQLARTTRSGIAGLVARVWARTARQDPQFLVILVTMATLPLSEVKAHLSDLVGRVHDHHERVTVTVHGRPSAVLISIEELEQLEETIAVLGDTETLRRLADSDAELARGEDVSADQLAETIRARRASAA